MCTFVYVYIKKIRTCSEDGVQPVCFHQWELCLNKGIKIQSLLYSLISALGIIKFFKQLHM